MNPKNPPDSPQVRTFLSDTVVLGDPNHSGLMLVTAVDDVPLVSDK